MTHTPRLLAALCALTALLVLLLGLGTVAGTLADHAGDVFHYFTVSSLVLRGGWPYRDFPLEYPALSLVPVVLPRLVTIPFAGGYAAYVWAFLVQNALLAAAVTWTVLRLSERFQGRNASRSAVLFLAGLLVVCPTLPWRYDIFPALLTALALQALLSRRPFRAGLWLGLGAAAKLYPLLLLPVFLLFLLAEKRQEAGRRLVLGSAAAVAACLLPFAGLPLPALLSFLRYHQMRGLEIESVPAGPILLAHLAGLTPVSVVFNYGAFHIVSPSAPPVIRCLPLLFVFALGGVLWKARRSFRREQEALGAVRAESLLVFLVCTLLAFILANKVFSPQYLIWLLPFVPLLRPRQALTAAAVFLLTVAIYPYAFMPLLLLEPPAVLLLALRNALAGMLLAGLLRLAPPAQGPHNEIARR